MIFVHSQFTDPQYWHCPTRQGGRLRQLKNVVKVTTIRVGSQNGNSKSQIPPGHLSVRGQSRPRSRSFFRRCQFVLLPLTIGEGYEKNMTCPPLIPRDQSAPLYSKGHSSLTNQAVSRQTTRHIPVHRNKTVFMLLYSASCWVSPNTPRLLRVFSVCAAEKLCHLESTIRSCSARPAWRALSAT